MDRRSFIKALGVGGAAALGAGAGVGSAEASRGGTAGEPLGLLVDTVRCVGCRTCEESCAKANGLPVPDIGDERVFKKTRRPTPTQWSVVNRFRLPAAPSGARGPESARAGGADPVNVKRQCMHCNQPACASACLVKAMHKTPEGPVVWRGEKCMGCRFCMLSCPYEIPKFEYSSANPRIRKCILCQPRIGKGKPPACVESCPAEALQFGKRSALLEAARKRIHDEKGKYVSHIYGEHEVGGSSVLYLAAVPFDKIGFRSDLGSGAYPELTKNFLYSVPVVFTLLPPFLLALRSAAANQEDDDHDH
jgi:Fe-S-cluster-containing dehydrogenase component